MIKLLQQLVVEYSSLNEWVVAKHVCNNVPDTLSLLHVFFACCQELVFQLAFVSVSLALFCDETHYFMTHNVCILQDKNIPVEPIYMWEI